MEHLAHRVNQLELALGELYIFTLRGFENMALDFSRLQGAVDIVAQNVLEVAAAIKNPAVDNNDQSVIDELAAKLENSAAALQAATADENAEDGVVAPEAPAPTDAGQTSDTPAADTSSDGADQSPPATDSAE